MEISASAQEHFQKSAAWCTTFSAGTDDMVHTCTHAGFSSDSVSIRQRVSLGVGAES